MTPYIFTARIDKIVDGDTIDATVDLGFHVQKKQRFRLARINTPEMNDPDEGTRQRAAAAREYLVSTVLGKLVKVESYKTDRYGRYIAEVTLAVTPQTSLNISSELIRLGHAEIYLHKIVDDRVLFNEGEVF